MAQFWPNTPWFFTAWAESPFLTLEKLKQIWADTRGIDSKVEQDIQGSQDNMRTQAQFQESFNRAKNSWKFADISDDQLIDKMLLGYKNRWLTIEWIDIDEELGVVDERKTTIIPDKEEPSLISKIDKIADVPWKFLFDMGITVPANIPNIWLNILWFAADVLTPKESEWLWDTLRELWTTTRENIQEFFWVDPESFWAKTWEFWSELATFFIPWWQSKLITKFPQASNKIRQIGQTIDKIWQKAPRLFNVLKSAAKWAAWVWAFEVVSEWEITPTWLAIWAVAWPIFDKVGKVISWPKWAELTKAINERFGKLALKLSPSKATKPIADKTLQKWSEWAIFARSLNPNLKVESVSDALTLSKWARDALWKELTTTRWLGNVNTAPVVKWIDDVTNILRNPTKLKEKAFDKKFIKEIDVLEKLPNRKAVIKTLQQQREDILWRWVMSLKQADDYIIWINQNLANFFAWRTDKLASQVDSAVASKLRQNLDDSIWGLWSQFRKTKDIYGKVRTFEDNLNKVYVQAIKRKDAWLWDFADTFILSNMWSSLASWDVAWFAKAFLQKWIKEQVKKQNDPNFVVQQLFKLIDKSLKSWWAKDILNPAITKEAVEKTFKKASPAKSAKESFDLKALKKVWEWSDRKVFDLWDWTVLKVAKNKRWLEQNLWALQKDLQEAWILANVKSTWKDFVIMEKLTPATDDPIAFLQASRFRDDMLKLSKELDVWNTKNVDKVLKKWWWEELAKKDLKKFWFGDIWPENLAFKNGKPVLIDEWTIELIQTVKKFDKIEIVKDFIQKVIKKLKF